MKLTLSLLAIVYLGLLTSGCRPKAQTPTPDESAPADEESAPTQENVPQQVQTKSGPVKELALGGAKLLAPSEAKTVAFSPDGRFLISGGGRDESESLLLWDLETGALRHRLAGLDPDIAAISVSANANRVAAAGVDPSLALWDLPKDDAEGALVRRLELSAGLVYGLALSPDGTLLAVTSGEGKLSVWNVDAGTERVFFEEAQSASNPAISLDGRLLAAAFHSPDSTEIWNDSVGVWDLASGALLWKARAGKASSLAFDHESKRLLAGVDGVVAWDAATGENQEAVGEALTAGDLYGLVVTKGGEVYAASSDGKVFNETGSFDADGIPLWALALSPDETLLAAAGASRRLFLWNRQTGERLFESNAHGAAISALAFASETMLLSGDDDGRVIGWDLPAGEQHFRLPEGAQPKRRVMRLAVHPDGKRFAVVQGGETVHRLWSVDGEPLASFAEPVTCEDLVFSPDGATFAAATSYPRVALYETATGALRGGYGRAGDPTLQNLMKATSVAFSPDGKRMVIARWDDMLRLYDLSGDDSEGTSLPGVLDVAWSPDGTLLAAGIGRINKGEDTVHLQLIEVATGKVRAEVEGAPSHVQFTPDGKQVLGLADGEVRLWNTEDGSPAAVKVEPAGSAIRAFALSPSGMQLAVGDEEGRVRVVALER